MVVAIPHVTGADKCFATALVRRGLGSISDSGSG